MYVKLGPEGKRALLRGASSRPRLQQGRHQLAVLRSATDGGSDARLEWENPVALPLIGATAFDEVSGRLYGLGSGRVEVRDLF